MIKKTLYFGNPVYLSLKLQQMKIVLVSEKQEKTIPVEDIGIVLLDNPQITITHGLIRALQENKVVIISCDEKHMPQGMMLPMEGNTLQSRQQKYQLAVSAALKKNCWQQTVKAKIKNQRMLLEHLDLPANRLKVLENRVQSGDTTNVEGQAAQYYWSQLFDDFYREREGDPPNNLLNYGYAILRSMVARALVSSGLMPGLGIFHFNQYNAYCLADDIMEPFRPFVDKIVYDLYEEGIVDLEDKLTKSHLLAIATMDGRFEKLRRPLLVGISVTTASLVRVYDGSRRKIIYPELIL